MNNAEKIIIESKKIRPLISRELKFLIAWHQEIKDREFGFSEVRGFNEQLKEAINFYLSTEKAWQDKVLSNDTTLDFNEFFEHTAKSQGVILPKNFNSRLHEEENNEIPRTE